MNIKNLLDESLKKEQDSRKDRKRSGKFSPSSLGKCYRAQIWNRMAVEQSNPPDERTLRVFAAGHLFHEFVQKLIPNKQVEVKIEDENFLGFADIVTDNMVIDLKSQHSRAFWYMNQNKTETSKEHMDRFIRSKMPNILQTTFYAWKLKKEFIKIAFISKDDLCIEEYSFTTAEFIHPLLEEIETLRKYWKNKILPPAKPRCYFDKKTGTCRECQYCNFLNRCKKETKQEVSNESK